ADVVAAFILQELGDRCLDWKLLAGFAPAFDSAGRIHLLAVLRRIAKFEDVAIVLLDREWRQQHIEMLPQCLRCSVAEGFLGLLVEDNNAELVVERDDGLTRQIEYPFQALTCDPAFFLDPLS